MKIYPAIDIINGKCVRLTRGEYDKVKEYSANPLQVARRFREDGAKMLHIVDLEGAKEGKLMNFITISNIDMPKQVGGGIRTYEDAKMLLDSNINRIIMSTSALEDPELIKRIVADFGSERIVVSLDIKDGCIAMRGWREISDMPVVSFLDKMREIGIEILIVTDIGRDGMLSGIDTGIIGGFLGQGFEIIVAGGVSGITDIEKLRKLGVDGAIIGKALYEGNLNLKTILSC